MKVKLNVRDKTWAKAVVALSIATALGVFLAVGGAIDRSVLPVVAGVFLVLLCGGLLFAFMYPRMWACMRVVKGQMSYRELQEAIAAEEFGEPVPCVFFDFLEPQRVLFSQNLLASEGWLLIGDIDTSQIPVMEVDDPVCIPKAQVTSIHAELEPVVYMDEDEYPPDDLDEYSRAYVGTEKFYVLGFGCADGQEFRSGLVAPNAIDDAISVLKEHFPQAKITVAVSEEQIPEAAAE